MTKKCYVDTAQGQTHVRLAGNQDSATAVVLLHPLAFDGDYFTTLLRELDGSCCYVIPDYPGFGESNKLGSAPSIEGFADVVQEVMQATSSSSEWAAIGFHTGCLVAAELSRRNESLIKKNILIDIPFFSPEQAAGMTAKMPRGEWPPADSAQLADLYDKTVPVRAAAFGAERAWDFFVSSVAATSNPADGFHGAFAYPAEQRFVEVSQATLAIATNSGLAAGTRRAASVLPNASLIEMPDVKGNVFELFAPVVAAAIRDFL